MTSKTYGNNLSSRMTGVGRHPDVFQFLFISEKFNWSIKQAHLHYVLRVLMQCPWFKDVSRQHLAHSIIRSKLSRLKISAERSKSKLNIETDQVRQSA